MQLFLHYPLQELHQLLFLTTKMAGLNDLEEADSGVDQLKTLAKIGLTGLRLLRNVLPSGSAHTDDHSHRYRSEFMQ